jgi:MFS superfamily sulfate permease-like transporter
MRLSESCAIGAYKQSKVAAERVVETMIDREHLPAIIVRPTAPIGPRDQKPTPTGRVIIEAASGRIPGFVDTGLNLVHVDDVACGHLAALRFGKPGDHYIPLVAFAVLGSSRHLVVADSATAAIFSSTLSQMATPASEKYMALVGMVALLTAGFLLLARIFKLGFLADFLSRKVLVGFLTGVGFQVGIAMLGDMFGVKAPSQRRRAQPGRATGLCRRRTVGTAGPHRPAAVPAALRAGEHRVYNRGRDGRHEGSARNLPRKFGRVLSRRLHRGGGGRGRRRAGHPDGNRSFARQACPTQLSPAYDGARPECNWPVGAAPAPATPGSETEPGLIVYRFGADLFYANDNRFADEVRCLVERAPTPVRWFIVDAGAITDIDYSAAQSLRDLLDNLGRQGVDVVFARVSPYLRSDMDRHGITATIGETQIFTTLHEAFTAVRFGALSSRAD